MECDMPECDKMSCKTVSVKGVFCGVSIDERSIRVCEGHSCEEVSRRLTEICEREAEACQLVNPFMALPECSPHA